MVRVLVLEARRRREPRVRWAGEKTRDGLVWWGRRKTKTKTAMGAAGRTDGDARARARLV